MTVFAIIVIALILAKLGGQLGLERLNERNVRLHASNIPGPFRDAIDPATYRKSVDYTLAKNRLHRFELVYDAVWLLVILFSGMLPWLYDLFQSALGISAWAGSAFLFSIMVLLSLPGMPFEWYAQFRLEERFGFNTSTQRLWWMDRLKGLLLGAVIGLPLLALILKLVDWTGNAWWLWAWATLLVFQLVMIVIAPVLILPLFNKFTPLPEGSLRDRLLDLARRTGFRAQSIQVMDGSKRSRHSNAFFTGFGKFRKIVLFDTLMQQLEERELEAVLAHEIGHYKKRHIRKLMIFSAVTSLAGFYALSVLAGQAWFYESFGFAPGNIVPALLLFTLLAGLVTFWFTPLGNWISRKHEYEADAFAAGVMKETDSMVGALRKLNEKNLSNLTPHPAYSGFYYSHPTLLEREQALQSAPAG
jgi:STE24 endopeptidase